MSRSNVRLWVMGWLLACFIAAPPIARRDGVTRAGRAVHFEPNRGQSSADVRYVARGGTNGRERALDDLLDAARQVRTLSQVRAERAHLRTRRAFERWTASAGASIATAVLLVGGAVLAGTGLVIRLRAVFADRPGVGELLAGALFVVIALVWGQVRRHSADRALIRRLQARHGFEQHDRSRACHPEGDHAR